MSVVFSGIGAGVFDLVVTLQWVSSEELSRWWWVVMLMGGGDDGGAALAQSGTGCKRQAATLAWAR